jgi:hypothetical protein
MSHEAAIEHVARKLAAETGEELFDLLPEQKRQDFLNVARKAIDAHNEYSLRTGPTDSIPVDWQSLKAAKGKLRKITREAEAVKDATESANMTHTAYKLGSFLDEALCGALSRLDDLDRGMRLCDG